MNLSELKDLADVSMPYVMVAYQIIFKEASAEYPLVQEKGAYYMREYVDQIWRQVYPDSSRSKPSPARSCPSFSFPMKTRKPRRSFGICSRCSTGIGISYLVTMAESPVQPAGASLRTRSPA
ncbi:hypothetical protein VQ056_06015 [Paenibacillus sp. JTLBN-2024]